MNRLDEQKLHRRGLAPVRLPAFARRGASGPFVVAIEGANGTGKTTLCRLLSRSLRVPSCLGTDDAWFSKAFKTRMIRDAEWFSSAMFFLSGCFERMRELRQRTDRLVIMDRSLWSTLAVHGAESPARLKSLLAMLKPLAGHIHVPDLTIVLEAEFKTCQSRIARKTGADRLLDELTAVPAFHGREKEFYLWLARRRSEVLFLDANKDRPEIITERAAALIRKHSRSAT